MPESRARRCSAQRCNPGIKIESDYCSCPMCRVGVEIGPSERNAGCKHVSSEKRVRNEALRIQARSELWRLVCEGGGPPQGKKGQDPARRPTASNQSPPCTHIYPDTAPETTRDNCG